MSSIPEFTIIGGGIMGMLTARELRLTGANVVLIERSQFGHESSWAGGGILLPIYPWRQAQAITDLVIQSLKLYPALVEAIQANSGIDPEFIQSGMLICKNPDVQTAMHWCESNAIRVETPPDKMLTNFDTQYDHPLWLPGIHQARNPRLIKAVYDDLAVLGVEMITDCKLLSLNISNNRVESVQTSTGCYSVEQLILTTGAWTGELWQQIFPFRDTVLPKIEPIKGQMLLFDAYPDTLSHMVLDGAHYLIPRKDGKILAGSTVESCGFDKTTDQNTRTKLTEFAYNLLPTLKDFPIVAHWAGLRPGTEQGIPYIAQHPTYKNLTLNAGHFRNGLTMAPASAQLLADILLNRPTAINPTPYHFDRPH